MDVWMGAIDSWFSADFPTCPLEVRNEMMTYYVMAVIATLGMDMNVEWKGSIFTRWKTRGLKPLMDGKMEIMESLGVLDYLAGKLSQKKFDSWAVEGRKRVKEMISGTFTRAGFDWYINGISSDGK